MKTVLLTIDALRADHLSQYGYRRETIPVLDRILEDGTQFDAAFANGTNTGVSLPSLLSSRYFGVDNVRDGPNVASALREDGVRTAGFHSNTLFSNRIESVTGFDTYEDFSVAEEAEEDVSTTERLYDALVGTLRPVVERLGVREHAERAQEFVFPTSMVHDFSVYTDAERLTDDLLSWVDEHEDEEFFLWAHYMDPHRPYGIDVDSPAFGEPADNGEIRELMSKAGIHPQKVTSEDRERLIDLYDSDLRYTSDQISRLIDGFQSAGIWDETNLVFTADHGEEFGEHGYYYHRNRPYDELIHVPLIVRRPEVETDGPVTPQRELLDIAPTLCKWHGVDPPEPFLGTPLFEEADRRVITTGSFVEQGHVVGGRWDDWKFIDVDGGDTELFDLASDPDETTDVAEGNPDRVASFRETIPDSVFAGESVSVDAEDEEVRKRLSELGYLE